MPLLNEFSLAGKTALITGGGRGIGTGIAEVFAEAGATVLVNALTDKHLVPFAQALRTRTGQTVVALPGDAASVDGVAALVTRALAIIPAVIVAALYGEQGTGQLLILSQVVLSLQLSFAVFPLVQFTSERAKMGVFTNSRRTKIVAWTVAILIAVLNCFLLIQTVKGWLGA